MKRQSRKHLAMKTLTLTAVAATLTMLATPAWADVPAAMPAMPAASAKFSLDTPVETLVANPATKAVLEANLPGITAHPQYETFKGMSLSVLAGFAPDKLTPERLAAVAAALAKIP